MFIQTTILDGGFAFCQFVKKIHQHKKLQFSQFLLILVTKKKRNNLKIITQGTNIIIHVLNQQVL
jgi:hypothetical protein